MTSKRSPAKRIRKLKGPQPFRMFIPSLITMAGLCFGLSAVRFAMLERWELCISFIFAAALIDALDGGAARLLRATSEFGAQLDSLSDFVCFGVAPALILYMWALEDIKRFGWAVVLFYAVCCALRLARFNTALTDEKEAQPWEKRFFTGIPSPAGGLLLLLPLMVAVESDMQYVLSSWFVALHMLIVGALMVSRVPTFAIKHIRIPMNFIIPFMLSCAVALVFIVIEPWKALILFGIGYICAIPLSVTTYRKLVSKHSAE